MSKSEGKIKREKNLRPAKKGEVRNPRGKKRGQLNFKTIYGRMLQQQTEVIKNGRSYKKPAIEVICALKVKDALDSSNTATERLRAANAIEDRVDGKPFQPLTGSNGTPLEAPIIKVGFVDGDEE